MVQVAKVVVKTYELGEWRGEPLAELRQYEDFLVAEFVTTMTHFAEGGGLLRHHWLGRALLEGIITTPAVATKLSNASRYWKITQMELVND